MCLYTMSHNTGAAKSKLGFIQYSQQVICRCEEYSEGFGRNTLHLKQKYCEADAVAVGMLHLTQLRDHFLVYF